MLVYQGYAKGNLLGPLKESPRAAAVAFFETHPHKRKCDIWEGERTPGQAQPSFMEGRYTKDNRHPALTFQPPDARRRESETPENGGFEYAHRLYALVLDYRRWQADRH